MDNNLELTFTIDKETQEKLKEILNAGGLKHYLIKLENNTEIDVVEYKDYKKLELELNDLKKELNKLRHTHYIIQNGRGNCKTYLMQLQKENKKYEINTKNLINYLKGAIEFEESGFLFSSNKRLKVYREILEMVNKWQS